jgi:hypothetical protein
MDFKLTSQNINTYKYVYYIFLYHLVYAYSNTFTICLFIVNDCNYENNNIISNH